MTRSMGSCAICGRIMSIRADGMIRTHNALGPGGTLTDDRCSGSGQESRKQQASAAEPAPPSHGFVPRHEVQILEYADGPPGPEEQGFLRRIVASNRDHIGLSVKVGKKLIAWIDQLTAENAALRARLAELGLGGDDD